jgi:hypothetical protein
MGKIQRWRDRTVQPTGDLGHFVRGGHPAGGQLAEALGAVPVV